MDDGEAVAGVERLLRGDAAAVMFQAVDAYVQFAEAKGTVRCEASGDANLPHPLTYVQLQALSRLHFFAPDKSSSGNHWRTFANPNARELVDFAVETLASVFAADSDVIEVVEV
jgi:hypothetical protein